MRVKSLKTWQSACLITNSEIHAERKENYILCETRKSVGIGTEAKKTR